MPVCDGPTGPRYTPRYGNAFIFYSIKLDGCIAWNAHNIVLGEEALLIYIVPVCYVKTGRYGKTYAHKLTYIRPNYHKKIQSSSSSRSGDTNGKP